VYIAQAVTDREQRPFPLRSNLCRVVGAVPHWLPCWELAKMQLSVLSQEDDVSVVRLAERLTPSNHPADIDELVALLGADVYSRQVLLDLAECKFIDSSGISWLLVRHKRFRESGGRMVLFSIPPMIDQVIRVLRLQIVFCLAADEKSARAMLAEPEK
jgi:anti-sigma B factor antagonist